MSLKITLFLWKFSVMNKRDQFKETIEKGLCDLIEKVELIEQKYIILDYQSIF